MNTNITGFRSLRPCALDESSLNIGRVKEHRQNSIGQSFVKETGVIF